VDVNAPLKRQTTNFTMTRPHSKQELIKVSEEMAKSKSIYLDRIKADIQRKTQDEFRVRRMASLPRVVNKPKTNQKKQLAFGVSYNSPRSHSMRNDYWATKHINHQN